MPESGACFMEIALWVYHSLRLAVLEAQRRESNLPTKLFFEGK